MLTGFFPDKLDYNFIAPGIYQGSKPHNSSLVRNDKFSLLILSAVEFQPPKERFKGVNVINAPLRDCYDITDEEMLCALQCADLVKNEVNSGGKCLITCYMGWNRSGLITALSLMKIYKMSGKQAVDHVRSMRKNALGNKFFVKIIENYKNKG